MGCGGSAVMDLEPIEERANEFATWVGKFDSEHRIPAAFASAADVPALLAEVERLREVATERAEVTRLRTMVGDCHCDKNPATTNGPEEDCPQHGRPVAEVWGLVKRAEAGWDHARAEVDRLMGLLEPYTREYPKECNKRVAAENERDAALAEAKHYRTQRDEWFLRESGERGGRPGVPHRERRMSP